MKTYMVFKDLAIIILAAECFGLLARKFKAPQVVGQILAGLLIGPAVLGFVDQSEFISGMAEVGVMLLMFSAGLGTDLKELLNTGLLALAVACAGVFVPLAGGTFLFAVFYCGGAVPAGSPEFYRALFIGTIMTATSVSITVQALRELGHLKSRVGTLILSAAIIDDVIGIIVLTFVISLSGGSGKSSGLGTVVIKILLFLIFTAVIGVLTYKLFKILDKRYPHRRRIPIFGLFFAMFMAFCAENFFGIADITGAYAAGLILCNIKDSKYIEEKMDISSYMIFGPIFFVNIGLKTEFSGMDSELLIFSLLFVLTALLAKIIGCGAVAKIAGYNNSDCLKVGVGMMTRGEVALIVSSKGLSAGLMEQKYFTPVILLIIISSVVTPIVLKILYSGDKDPAEDSAEAKTAAT